MRDNNRDVELKISAVVGGAGDVQGLAGDIDRLAQSGESAAPAFDGLAGNLDALGAELEKASAATKTYRAAEAGAKADVEATKRAFQEQKDALGLLRITTDAAGRSTDEYRAKVQAARLASHEAGIALRAKRGALTEASTAARIAAASEKALADQLAQTAAAFRAEGAAAAEASRTASAGLAGLTGQLSAMRNLAGAALGGTIVGSLAADLGRTADSYSNLAARIRLATGEGAAFKDAFEGVFGVAQRTGTAVESVGALFTKLSTAGKELKLSNADLLALTETITQATQLSGASAESSTAAIVQFTQAIASGVLRGDELNSTLEQAPRLAQALADGLGVTTGELRKLGEAGALTSTQVIQALQGQAAALEKEFGQLPQTIGRAVTNLGSAWTKYVGEADQATGASAQVASAINLLSGNLDTMVGVLLTAGKAWTAYQALKLAQFFRDKAIAISTATVALEADTVATRLNTTAKIANAAASTAAAGSVTGIGAAAAGTAGRLSGLMAGVSRLGAIGAIVATAVISFDLLRDAIKGASAGLVDLFERWDGSKRRAKEQADAEANLAKEIHDVALQRAAEAQATKFAAEAALGLTAASKQLVTEFEGLRTKGDSVAEALGKVAKSLDLSNTDGIKNAGVALDALRAKGAATAEQLQTTWSAALKGVDLAGFTIRAKQAFDGSEAGARRLAAALDGAVREAVVRTGVDFELLSRGISTAADSALKSLDIIIDNLDRLKAQGVDTGKALTASIGKAIETADSQQAIDALIARIEAARAALGNTLTDSFLDAAKQKALDLGDALDKALPGINSLREAFKTLGLQAPEDLKRIADANKAAWETIRNDGTLSIDVLKRAFTTYAESAIAAAGKGREVAEALLKGQAAAKGLAVEFDKAGRVIVKGANEATEALREVVEAQVAIVGAVEDEAAAREKSIAAREKEIELAEREAALAERKRQSFNTAGDIVNVEQATFASVVSQLKGLGVSDARAISLAREFADTSGNVPFENPGQKKYGQPGDTLSAAIARAASHLLFNTSGGALAGTPSAAEPPIRPVVPPPAPAYQPVNINIDGRRTQLRVVGPGDAEMLTGLLEQLAGARSTAA